MFPAPVKGGKKRELEETISAFGTFAIPFHVTSRTSGCQTYGATIGNEEGSYTGDTKLNALNPSTNYSHPYAFHILKTCGAEV